MPDLSHLPTAAEVFAEMDARMDAEARARWERTALARAVANAVVAYRTAHRLSQKALAAEIGMKRPAIARLELGEHNPSNETLERLASVLGLRFIVDVAPRGRAGGGGAPAGRTRGRRRHLRRRYSDPGRGGLGRGAGPLAGRSDCDCAVSRDGEQQARHGHSPATYRLDALHLSDTLDRRRPTP